MVFLSLPNVLELSRVRFNASINLSTRLTLRYITGGWNDNGSETYKDKVNRESAQLRENIRRKKVFFRALPELATPPSTCLQD